MKKRLAVVAAFVTLMVASTSAMATIYVGVADGFKVPFLALAAAYDSSDTYGMANAANYVSNNMLVLYNNVNTALAASNPSPYDLFLSANTAYPENLHTAYPLVVGSSFNYAVGKLVLWSVSSSYNVSTGDIPDQYFADGKIIDACTSNGAYGVAADYVMENSYDNIDPTDTTQVHHETIMSDVVANVLAGTYPIGFVGNAQVSNGTGGYKNTGSYVNSTYYAFPATAHPDTSLTQAAVEIARAARTSAESTYLAGFITFIQSATGRAIIANYGYTLP